MNDSGKAVSAAARFYKLEPDAVLVVHDEIDLEHGRLQARKGGGFAGHNGLRSIAAGLKTPDFLRLRIGVGRPGRGDPRKPADYVLSNFAPDETPSRSSRVPPTRSRSSMPKASSGPRHSTTRPPTRCSRTVRGYHESRRTPGFGL